LRTIINTTRSDDRPELVSVVREAAGTAGIDVAHLFMGESAPDSSRGSTIETSSSADEFGFDSRQIQRRATTQRLNSASGDEIDSFVKHTCLGTVNSGAWMNPFHYMPLTSPPEDIIPYLGDARFTLAGQMFWTVLEHGQSALERVQLHKTWEDFLDPVVRRMMTHSKPLASMEPVALKAMVDSRLEYRNFGYITSHSAIEAEASANMELHKLIKEDYLSRGKDPNMWLTPFAVEWRVRAILGNTLFAMLETASRSPESSIAHQSVKGIVKKLVDNFVCFGDGPRWAVWVVDEVISEWVSTVKS
jgi:hypothetical protein